jgi:hypothetical protein
MPTQPQQRKQVSNATFLRLLLGDIAKQSTPASSPTSRPTTAQTLSQASTTAPEPSAAGITAATPSHHPSTTMPYTHLARPVFPKQDEGHNHAPSRVIGLTAPMSSSQQSSLDSALPAKNRSVHQDRATTLPRETRQSLPPLRPSWGGDCYRPAYASHPLRNDCRDTDTGRGCDSYIPNYTTTPEPAPVPHSPRVRQLSSTATKSLSQHTVSDATDELIARLNKPHPKLLAQAVINGTYQDTSARRSADIYRPAPKSRSVPQRLNSQQLYSTWNMKEFLREANIRHLAYEHEDPDYLAEIMLVNDRKFFQKWDEYKHLSIKELLEEAELENVSIARNKHWEHRPLLMELAEKVAQLAVARYNDLRRAEGVARQATQVRTTVPVNRPLRSNHFPRFINSGKKLKDLALNKKKDAETATKEMKPSVQSSGPRFGQNKQDFKQKKAESRPCLEYKFKMSTGKGSEHTDSGYSTGHTKSSKSPSTSTSTISNSAEDVENNESPIDCSEERTNIQHNNKQDSSKSNAEASSKEHLDSKKRSRSIEDQEQANEQLSKKAKTTPEENVPVRIRKVLRAGRTSTASLNHDEEMKRNADTSATKLQPNPTKIYEINAPNKDNALKIGNRKSKIADVSPSRDVALTDPELSHKCKSWTIDDEDEDFENISPNNTKQGTKRKAKDLTPQFDDDSEDSDSASSTGDDRPKKSSRGKHGSKVRKTAKEPKLRGIPTSKRIPGLPYTQYADGSWKVVKRARPAQRKPAAAEPKYNYIK